jgi:hypothetical protein
MSSKRAFQRIDGILMNLCTATCAPIYRNLVEKVEAMEQNLQQVKLMVSQILLRLFFHSSLNPQLLPIKEL